MLRWFPAPEQLVQTQRSVRSSLLRDFSVQERLYTACWWEATKRHGVAALNSLCYRTIPVLILTGGSCGEAEKFHV